jgi:VWFA-related protein
MRQKCPLSLLATLSLLQLASTGTSQQQVPTTRAEVVQLDVIVTDAEGNAVRGLTQADFEVLEDKKAQRITNFVFVEARQRADAGAPPSTAAESAAAAADDSAEPPASPGRHMVIVIDDLHIAPGNFEFVKGALQRMVGEFLGPDDSLAILTTSSPAGARSLSQDKTALQQQIALLKFSAPAMPPAPRSDMSAAQAELILRGDRNARKLAGRSIIDQPGSVYASATSPQAATEQGQAAIQASGGTGVSAESLEAVAEKEAERQARGILNEALRYSVASLHAIEDVLRSLAPLPGRKLCLLVSDGFLVGAGTSEERTRDMRAIVDAATRSGAVVYAVDSRGLQNTTLSDASVAGTAVPVGLQSSVDRQAVQLTRLTLENIAEDTGGYLVTGTNAFDDGLKRVLRENDSYYLMAYEPANKSRDGKYRKIEVKVKRPVKYVVRTRAGYLAPDDKAKQRTGVRTASASPEPRGIEESEARAIIDASRAETSLPLHLAADFVSVPPDGSVAVVRAHADVASLSEASGGGVAVDFLGGVYDASGKAIGPAFGRHTPVPAAALADARKEGVFFQQRLALPPGRYEVRLAARDVSRTKLGGASQWVEIPDLKDGALALSGVFLSTSTPKAGAAEGAGGEDLRDVQALRRFKNRDNLFFQVYVYNLKGEAEGASDAVLQAQLRQGETLVAASQPQPIKLERKDGVLLPQTNGMPLESLPRGSYQLRVVVMDKKANATIHRQVDFTIE